MADYSHQDAGHLLARDSSETSSETLEMSNLEEIAVTPNPLWEGHTHEPYLLDEHDSDDESGADDEGRKALLGDQVRPRGRERPALQDGKVSLWAQVKGIVIECAPTLLFTTVGLLFTGELLNNVSHWKAMSRIDELIMIIPVVLNLKGNLEMNLSARLGTAANIGELDQPKVRRSLILGNLSLLQVQATVVSFVAACVSFALGRLMPKAQLEEAVATAAGNQTVPSEGSPSMLLARSLLLQARKPRPSLPKGDPGGLKEFLIVVSSSMSAACLSSLILGSFMCTLVVLCRRFGLDPDNIAPPVASCLGDLVTLCLLGIVSAIYIFLIDTPIPLILSIILILAAVGWTFVTRRNERVRHLLKEGWVPLFAAMIISCGTGIILDLFVSRYEGFALLAVVISGLPGSAGSIFVSRLSTALHAASLNMSSLPSSVSDYAKDSSRHQPSPRVVMITLLCVTFPVELIFLATLRALGWLHIPIVFAVFSVIFFCIAVLASLLIAQGLTNLLWKRDYDPDMYALPIHSALMDLIGQLLLVVCFEIVSVLGAQPKKLKEG